MWICNIFIIIIYVFYSLLVFDCPVINPWNVSLRNYGEKKNFDSLWQTQNSENNSQNFDLKKLQLPFYFIFVFFVFTYYYIYIYY